MSVQHHLLWNICIDIVTRSKINHMKKTATFLFLFFGLLSSASISAQINAFDDTFSVIYGASEVTAGNVLNNDTLNTSLATLGTVTITQISSTHPGISLSGSNVVIAAGTPQGTYTLTYTICSIANSALCDTATVTIRTKLSAKPDSFLAFCYGGTLGSVLGSGTDLNYVDTLNGVPVISQTYITQPGNIVHPANVTLSVFSDYPEIHVMSNGNIIVSPGLPEGSYTIVYELREIADPDNSSVAYVTINVLPRFIQANSDYLPDIDNTLGGLAGNILSNDFLECVGPLNQSNATVSIPNLPAGFTLDPNGNLFVAPGTVPGNYALTYTVCEIFGNQCINSYAYINVTGPSTLIANYDDFGSPNYANTTTASVLNNDTLVGLPVNSSQVTLTPLGSPAGFTFNANGTIGIGAVPEGTYTVPYKICQQGNTGNCYVSYAYVVVLKNRIVGTVRFDGDANGCSVTDPVILDIGIKNTNGTTTYSSTTSAYSSEYYLIGDNGTNTVSVTGLPSYFSVTPSTQVFNLTTPGTVTAPDFCVSANSNVDDLEIVLIPLFNVVPGLPAFYNIWFKNNGSTLLDGQVTFQFDNSKMTFLDSSPDPDGTTANSVTYAYASLRPFESRLIRNVKLQVNTPPTVDAGQVAHFSGNITPVATDYTPANNTATVNQTVVNSQDPNDIIVNEGDAITLAEAQQGYLHYTIRFQNIGTSEAINIKVLNDLDSKLDWSTFKIISTSHPCRLKNTNNHNEFLFENINLPGTSNEAQSHGYISFKVKPVSSIAVGDNIPNVAQIYFDYNAPIMTNTVNTVITDNLGTEIFESDSLDYFPNPTSGLIHFSMKNVLIDKLEITDILGKTLISKSLQNTEATIDLSHLNPGIYFAKIRAGNQKKTVKLIRK